MELPREESNPSRQMLADAIRIEDGELEEDLSPVLNASRPLAHNVHSSQVKHFEQGFIRREDASDPIIRAKVLHQFTLAACIAASTFRKGKFP